ncbi:FAD-linked oxidase [Streptomyces albireticuli]|uniref:FAD-linked oxidase n=1 Tax=Streptomyces albireticuli TaxID=1940 RepID=A0A1Z2LBH6_9ACTN|nr:FAD-binding oxidoreductase [Streptomyces albireticuli]ARZ71581.1 FAD-linked oxidase [Streptomyces albireticuli]
MLNRRTILTGTAAAAGAAGASALGAGPAATAVAAPAAGAGPTGPAVAVLPDDPRYAALTVGNNTRWTARPESVRLARTTEQVVQVVQEAVRGGKRLSVRGGGHCYADFVFHPDVRIVLDMSAMDQVSYDASRKAFAVEAGASLLHVYESLHRGWGVGLPGGSCYSVGVGGHISGGGYGMLSRRHGLTVDHLYAVEVVVVGADGTVRPVIATREPDDPHRDLWWAHTGGGGGNFGVITRYWFRTPGATGDDPARQLMRPPGEVYVSALSLPWNKLDKAGFTTLVKNFGGWHERHSDPGSPYASLCSFLMLNHRSHDSVGMLTQMDASVPGARQLLDDHVGAITSGLGVEPLPLTRPVGEQGPLPAFFTPRRLPWLTSVKLLGTNNPTLTNPTLRAAHKSAYMRKGFDEAQTVALYRHLTRTDRRNPDSMVVLLSYGGRINTVRPADTAAAQRDSVFKALFQSFWSDEGDDAPNLAWTREAYTDVFSATGGYPVPGPATDGCYINYPDSDITDPRYNTSGVPWYTLYYKDNYPRLQKVKAAYDPRNVFRHSQSIGLPRPLFSPSGV